MAVAQREATRTAAVRHISQWAGRMVAAQRVPARMLAVRRMAVAAGIAAAQAATAIEQSTPVRELRRLTLTAALFLGFKREEAARFSFRLGLPAIALAGLKELSELRHAGLDAHGWLVLAVGLVIASLSAFVAIWGLLRILERFSAWPFAVYRAFIGAVLLAGVAIGWLG